MSSTNRGAARSGFDSYPTPRWAIARLLEAVDWKPVGTWLEPCAGDGRIIQTVDRYYINRGADRRPPYPFSGIHWHAWDIQQQCEEPLRQLNASVIIGDMVELTRSAMVELQAVGGSGPDYSFDIVITNPPYNIAMDVLIAARKLAPVVALLLRRNFIGSAKRHPYLSQNMPAEYLLPNRPSFIWSHKYTLKCDACGVERIAKVPVPAGQRAEAVGSVMAAWHKLEYDGDPGCSRGGQFRVADVKTTTADSCEYCWCVWTPKSGPVGSTRMLALTSPEEMAKR